MLKTEKVAIPHLKVGMFVSALDRPWLETPFLIQGFFIQTADDIASLGQYCEYVYVDHSVRPRSEGQARTLMVKSQAEAVAALFPGKSLHGYSDSGGWHVELPRAKAALDTLADTVKSLLEFREKVVLDLPRIKKAVEPMIESVSRNPDACLWLGRMRKLDNYTYQHSLGCAIWCVALGRQLGLPKSDLRSLAVGGLLFDAGKLKIDRSLLLAPRALTEAERPLMQKHVQESVKIMRKSGVINQDVLEMAAYHHERVDGEGYPFKLAGNSIPVFARIAAIADCYDALISQRPYAQAKTPAEAIKVLYDEKGKAFQPELVEEFIQAVGIYPAGSLVELSSGEVAVVVAEYRSRRLRPQVIVVLDENKEALIELKILDLMQQTHTADGKPLEILGSLEAGAFGIDLSSIEL
ncbi:HD-GYP domain-containing protein [Simiduia sp. 21SJ11W-1]|uniref:HD-GYP domain-containing protein n=1 Tax=Simiduia sp. 21SJ11W-1 TaxID=2909669 RepID=UPI00209DE5D6|nr:HD-GYP domain-containing protein [Simiduia sp. 21SJ11W-1]UTA46712.1 HD-GYP domain-containing protein [Simiduia sp. 21SJ11W-1]